MRQVDAEVAVSVDSGDPVASDTLVAADPAAVAGCDRVFDDAVDTGVGIDRVDILEDRRADRSELRTDRRVGIIFNDISSVSFAKEERPRRDENPGFPSASPAAMRNRRMIYIAPRNRAGLNLCGAFYGALSGGCRLIEGRPGSDASPSSGLIIRPGTRQAGTGRAGCSRAIYARKSIYRVQDGTSFGDYAKIIQWLFAAAKAARVSD